MTTYSIDIETIPQPGIINTWYKEWAASKYPGKEDRDLASMAALYPEFGEIVSISMAKVNEGSGEILTNTIHRDGDMDERTLLSITLPFLDRDVRLVGHNLKGFDLPFPAKRYMANGFGVPSSLRVAGKKPWELVHVDTMEVMRFGGGQPMSLRSACRLLGLKDPKENCSGSDVWSMWKDGKFDEIGTYNEGDAVVTLQVYEELVKRGAFA